MLMNPNIRTTITLIARRMQLLMDARLAPYNITPQQARIVGFVGWAQERGQPIYQKDIEERFELTGPSVTSLLQGLERKDFITRRADPTDERRKQVIVLAQGLKLQEEFNEVFRLLDERLVHGLTTAQQELLRDMLEQLAHNVE